MTGDAGRCVVCIPARNEREALPRLLAALAAQQGFGPARPLKVLLLANNCTDDTAAVARAQAHASLDLRVAEIGLHGSRAHVGEARRHALALGMEWLAEAGPAADAPGDTGPGDTGPGDTGPGVLISGDADATPPPHWVAANLRALAAGADCVGGEIRLDESEPLPPGLLAMRDRVARYWAAVRGLADRIDPAAWDPAPHHGDHVAASLAIPVAFYRAVGGLPPLPSGEDNALVAAVERAGGRVRHAPEVYTVVSAREQGRASGGMAGEMAKWRSLAESGAAYPLPGASFWLALMRRRRALRDAFRHGAPGGLPPGVWGLAAECPNDIAFVARALPLLPALPEQPEDIAAATSALEALVLEDPAMGRLTLGPAARAGSAG